MIFDEILRNSQYNVILFTFLFLIVLFSSNILSLLHRKRLSLLLGMIFTSTLALSGFYNYYQILFDLGLTSDHPFIRKSRSFFLDYQSILLILTWTGLILYNLEMNKLFNLILNSTNVIFFLVYFELTILHESVQTVSLLFEVLLDELKINSTQLIIYWFLFVSIFAIFLSLLSFRNSSKYYYLFRIKFLIIASVIQIYRITVKYGINTELKLPSNADLNNLIFENYFLNADITRSDFLLTIFAIWCGFIFFTPPQSIYLRYQRIMSSNFDLNLSRLLIKLSKDAYLEPKSYPKENHGLTVVGHINNEKTTTLVNVLHKGNNLYIVFQGSTSWKNYVLDVVPFKVKFPHENNPLPFQSRINKGFHEMFHSIEEDLHKLIKPFMSRKNLHIYVTGHSLGGALAILCGLELKESYGKSVTVYNFGGLRVGNLFFARRYNRLVPDTYRIVNDEDVAPKVQFLSYKHVGHLVFIKPTSKIWVNPSIWFILLEIIDDIFGFMTGKALSDHRSQKYLEILDKVEPQKK